MEQKKLYDIQMLEHDGIVMYNTENPEEWGEGIMKMLIDARVVKDRSCFAQPFFVISSDGRKDTVIPFAKKSKIKMPQLVGWKQFFSNAHWIYDYIDKYKDEHDN